jgi:hypothetical protein
VLHDLLKKIPHKAATELICLNCGRTFECGAVAALAYTRQGWPKCCEEVMSIKSPPEDINLSEWVTGKNKNPKNNLAVIGVG